MRIHLCLFALLPLIAQTPVPTSKVQPDYSPEARAAGLQGAVLVGLQINPDGAIAGARLIRGLGMGLDDRALAAVRQWNFPPKPGADAKTESFPVEVPFLFDPPAPWRISGAFFRVDRATTKVNTLSLPVLSRYTAPLADVCSGRAYVTVNLAIGPDGAPSSVEVTAPETPVAQAARDAVRSWRFQPASLNGERRAAHGTVLIECAAGVPESDDFAAPVFKVGGGVTAPSILFKVEPEYSEEARKAKYQGGVLLSLVVESSGRPSHIKVVRALGLGLDEQAIVAVTQWRFKPGTKDGQPVRVQANVSVNFRLL